MSEVASGIAPGAADVDTIQGLGSGSGLVSASGTVGQRLLSSGFNVNALRTEGTLMKDEWVQFDNVVMQVSREKLVAVGDLISRGLVYNLPNAMGTMTLEWQKVVGDLVDAEITMSGLNEATKDRLEFGVDSMPIPIIHKEFFYNLRNLEAARRHGRNVETEHAEVATRKVAERIESLLFNGLTIAGRPIYGLLTQPQRNTGSVTASWATATGEQIIADAIRMVDAAAADNMEGPFQLYISRTVAANLGKDYKANSDKTILQRLREVPGIDDILVTTRLSGTTVLLVQMTSDVVQLINGFQPMLVEWDSHGGFQQNFKVVAILLPRVRADGWGQSGIVHFS